MPDPRSGVIDAFESLGQAHAHTPAAGHAFPLRARLRMLAAGIDQVYAVIDSQLAAGVSGTRLQEWLLDNRHIIDEALESVRHDLNPGFLAQLACVADEGGVRLRDEALCEALYSILGTPIDTDGIELAVDAYQSDLDLTLAELWALPAFLRMTLISHLIEQSCLCLHARAGDETGGSDQDEDVSTVAGCIISLRQLSITDWRPCFERLCRVETILRSDPAGAYPDMDFDSRNRYREEVELLARGTGRAETDVAARILERCHSAEETVYCADHVGYYLIGPGRHALAKDLGYRSVRGHRLVDGIHRHPASAYFGVLITLTLGGLAVLVSALTVADTGPATTLFLALVALVPITGIAQALLNGLATRILPARVLVKMDYAAGIPASCRTAVVVPALLGDRDDVERIFATLEINYLNNTDDQFVYVLLGDLPDAEHAETGDDAEILDGAAACTRDLNRRHGGSADYGPFLFLCRRRRWNPAEDCWMGRERKRGKLMAFNRLLAGREDTDFSHRTGDDAALKGVRFVITLDADTLMPTGAARRLVGTMAHPLSRTYRQNGQALPRGGYSILQPRLEVEPESTRPSPFIRTFSGDTTLDLYTHAVSDIYQDLFGEGIYAGKGIYDWRSLDDALESRIPENRVLSHDLLEGVHSRVGLVSDVVLLEQFPSGVVSWMRRLHRWTRGDWQLLPWLAPRVPDTVATRARNPLPAIHRWKIADNLRRSLQPPAVLVLLFATWLGLVPGPARLWTLLFALLLAAPLISGLLEVSGRVLRGPRALVAELRNAPPLFADRLAHWGLSLLLLPYQAHVQLDAIGRTLYRLLISRRHLLEWVTAARVDRQAGRGGRGSLLVREMWQTPVIAVAGTALIAGVNPAALAAAAPLLAAWLLAPLIMLVLDRPSAEAQRPPAAREREQLRMIARRTWAFFERHTGPDDHWLPPDSLQEEPEVMTIRRTSPTNMGMALVSMLAAHDLGYLDLAGLGATLRNTLDRMQDLERYRGHWYNWYSTRDMAALEPRYVSTVDSGNLAACLVTLARGLEETIQAPLDPARLVAGIDDTLAVLAASLPAEAGGSPGHDGSREMADGIAAIRGTLALVHDAAGARRNLWRLSTRTLPALTRQLVRLLEAGRLDIEGEQLRALRTWLAELRQQTARGLSEVDTLQPWHRRFAREAAVWEAAERPAPIRSRIRALRERLDLPTGLAGLTDHCRAAIDILDALDGDIRTTTEAGEWKRDLADAGQRLREHLEQAAASAEGLRPTLADCAVTCERLVDEMDFGFLYDTHRDLFHIGFDATRSRLDPNFYDLLASEARLTSFLTIARGQVPARHWLHLGRPFRRLGGRGVLMSWGATLFEYLMPELFMTGRRDSLLGRGCRSAVTVHRRFARRFHLPWGIAESGYHQFDDHKNYQYRAFGVPGLGYRRDLGDRLVIAPYASMLALALDPAAVMQNLEHLRQHGALGPYGLYEAIDFGRREKRGPRRGRLVRSYMSHHQGMILLAIDNRLNDQTMVRRFRADRRNAGVTMLLHERIPRTTTRLKAAEPVRPGMAFRPIGSPAAEAQPVADGQPRCALLSNGHLSVLLDARGGGSMVWNEIALLPWRGGVDAAASGCWHYLRDLDRAETFSLGVSPVDGDATQCRAQFAAHEVVFERRACELMTRVRISLSSQQDIEARHFTLADESGRPRRLLFATAAEVAMAPAATFRRHPAFARLFVESEYVAGETALLFRRRPRSSLEKPLHLMHALVLPPEATTRIAWETDRCRLYGRGRDARAPAILDDGLEGFTNPPAGVPLDPVIGHGMEVILEPYGRLEFALLTVIGRSREEVFAGLHAYRSMARVDWIAQQAQMQSSQELHNLGLTPDTLRHSPSLLAGVFLPDRERQRLPDEEPFIRPVLWARGISGDRPILLARIGAGEDIGRVERLLQLHTLWAGRRAGIDLVILDDESSGYMQTTRERLVDMVATVRARTHRQLDGGVYILSGRDMDATERDRLLAAAALVIDTGDADFPAPARTRPPVPLPALVPLPSADRGEETTPPLPRPDDLRFDNGLGGFSPDGREYVIHFEPDAPPPAPWINVLANPDFGTLVSESGSLCAWAGNSSEYRLTPWSNDPVADRGGEAVYLRDEETGATWSPTGAPRPEGGSCLAAHGAGYSRFRHHGHGLVQSMTVHVDAASPVRLTRLEIENTCAWTRRITVTAYAEWVLGNHRDETASRIRCWQAHSEGPLMARSRLDPVTGGHVAFLCASRRPHGVTTDRREFLGPDGGLDAPAALERIGLSGRVHEGGDPCAAWQVHLDIAPGETAAVDYVLGAGRDAGEVAELARQFATPEAAERSLARTRRFWDDLLDTVQVSTPEPAMDLLLNRWLLHQVLAGRLWGRTGFYQPSGARGFRDQLQDVMALVWASPERVRDHILLAASRQFEAGDVLHWWHDEPLRGVRTRCSDDMLWLPYVTAHYVNATGDMDILDQVVPYLHGAPLDSDETERYAEYRHGCDSGTLMDHCLRAINRAGTVGPHGLPTIGSGDWNDGMNRVSTTGRGESIWLGWFLVRVWRDFVPLCAARGDAATAEYYRNLAEALLESIEDQGWDGRWYRRAYYDDGSPLGSADNEECRIDLIAQVWSVLAQDEITDRARQAMAAAHEHLVRRDDRLILLLTPPFDHDEHDPGYIKGYPPGLRENGAQYTHAATWAVWAAARMGDGDGAMELFRLLNPVLRTTTSEAVDRYRVEPYVLPGDVYSQPPHVGRGGWTWYSGAAAWLYRAGLEALLGLRLERGDLRIDPCLPADWTGYRARIRRGRAHYDVQVEKLAGLMRGRVRLWLDGEAVAGETVPLVDDGAEHTVRAVIGEAEGRATTGSGS